MQDGDSNKEQIEKLRKDYQLKSLSENDIDRDPFVQFGQWFNEALSSGLYEPNAMTLATCSSNGAPSARIVLLKSYSDKGFVFYTNYLSRKGVEIIGNPNGAIVFYWAELERQIRIVGQIEKINVGESNRYFHSRPRNSQIGAAVSPQSRVIENRQMLEADWKKMEHEMAGKEIEKPDQWGGFCLVPHEIEFWQGRTSRLHDRLVFYKNGNRWDLRRLAP